MTIAACYLSPEGVVFGADSTASLVLAGGFHYFNNNQKLFELGEDATCGIVTWGLGGLGTESYRTHFALLADDLKNNKPASVNEVATRWSDRFWTAYTTSSFTKPSIDRCKALHAKPKNDPSATSADPNARTRDEENEYENLRRNLFAGFCIGGYVEGDRAPAAFEILFDPLANGKPTPAAIQMHRHRFWGAPSMTDRLIYGCDADLRDRILKSGKWNATDADLDSLIGQGALTHPILPIRDAIDFVHACIYSTIKGLKFSSFSQTCGGPIELAVITTDRRFRWVHHKEWDAAMLEGELLYGES